MAPESVRDRIYTPKTDAWAFGNFFKNLLIKFSGITLIEIYTHAPPFPDYDPLSFASRVSIGELNPSTFIPNNVEPKVASLMRQCFSYSPDQRPLFGDICSTLA